jgi:predicted alpha/beta hydrolase family esterase
MRQVVAIHGGHVSDTYEEYIAYLKGKELDFENLNQGDWKSRLQETLGEKYQVILPSMPCKQNPKYLEWKIWFEKFIPHIQDNAIFIGHSLGGIFLAKYFSEEKFPRQILATILVAAPFNTPTNHPRADFNLLMPLDTFAAQSKQIILYQSKDDQIVPFTNVENYQSALPKARSEIFNDRGHFNQEQLPEIIETIKNL